MYCRACQAPDTRPYLCQILNVQVDEPFWFLTPGPYTPGKRSHTIETFVVKKNPSGQTPEYTLRNEDGQPLPGHKVQFILTHPDMVVTSRPGEKMSKLLGVQDFVPFTLGADKTRYEIRNDFLLQVDNDANYSRIASADTVLYILEHKDEIRPI